MQQDQAIKGFTLLELIVVILIISILSAVSYPSYSKWKKDREVRSAAEKVASLIANISTLTQRGSFAYSQLLILKAGSSAISGSGISIKGSTVFMTRGMKDNKFSIELSDNNGSTKCNEDIPGNWNKFEGQPFYELYDPESSIDKINVTTHLNTTSAVCFGRGGNYYKVNGSLKKMNNKNINLDGTPTANYIILCHGSTCDVKNLDEPTYLVKWSRFGNISKYRYNYKKRNPIERYDYKTKDAWNRQ